MKKLMTIFSVILIVASCSSVYAVTAKTTNGENTITETNQSTTSKLIEIKEKELKTLDEYKEAYGSDSYGLTAFLLNRIRIYSIPFGFVAIIISAIYQYIIGIKKLDVRDKGFALMIASVTLVVICQVLPLVFAIVVKGWRS